ncbi:hypothetical protein SALBM311S_03809 [Streptomyces alboniger]
MAAPNFAGAAAASRRAGYITVRIAGTVGRRVLMLVVLLALVFAAVELLPGDAASASASVGRARPISPNDAICWAWTGRCGNGSPTG